MHIHLADHHDHGGSHHQHDAQAHAHYTENHHVDTIDSLHTIGDFSVVDLDYDCTLPACKKLDNHPVASVSISFQLLFTLQSTNIQSPEFDSNEQSYTAYSTIMLRAPPKFS